MHISEGILSAPVLIAGGLVAVGGTTIGLKRLDYDQLPKAGILAAAFLVASLIHIPIGIVSIHLVLNSLCGLMLGWGAFPVILVALVLQAIFFQFGGLTTLGVNVTIMALPAILVFFLFKPFLRQDRDTLIVVPFLAGFCAILFSVLVMAVFLFLSSEEFLEIAGIIAVANIPTMVIEGVVTLSCVHFLKKVYPALLFSNGKG